MGGKCCQQDKEEYDLNYRSRQSSIKQRHMSRVSGSKFTTCHAPEQMEAMTKDKGNIEDSIELKESDEFIE